MRNALRVIIAGVLLASASVPSDAARRAPRPSQYDGVWSVVISTLRGDCESAYRASVRISGGRIYSEDQSYQAYGEVSSGGAIRVVVAQRGQTASGYGRLSRDSGGGRWRTSNGKCSGQWTASLRPW